jgi:hypothetical protein
MTAQAVATEKATMEAAANRAAEAKVEATKKATDEAVGSSSSPASEVGTKRVATPGGSTPPPKRFRGPWAFKGSWYAV